MNPPIQQPVFLIETHKIGVNPFQPRKYFDEEKLKELASSIREYGILQPLVVTKVEEVTDTGTNVRYELIAGERRWRASQLVGLERVPAIIKNVGLDRERLEMAIVENVQRADLNPIESARAYSRLQDEFQLTQREIAARIGKSRESVANCMRLLNLPTVIQEAVSMGQVGESQARLLLSVDDIQQQELLFADILKNNLSVRELKGKIDYLKSIGRKKEPGEQQRMGPLFDPETESIKKQLEETLGTPVKVERAGDHGKITIEYSTMDDLKALLGRLGHQDAQSEFAPPSETTLAEAEAQSEPDTFDERIEERHYGPEHSDDSGGVPPVDLPTDQAGLPTQSESEEPEFTI
ncbi:MAG: hypothetical protein COU11_02585 [Candidatus Harrisonbacteria bacterium CG10_big_fil_rev_8_21_14_0_10_49_15]|uniref:ParB-like N-terminal domain-containing protein n=1 Tax=Candidatus Harrisonbacteria bacterium CG10_big_fil_rev_8_21_14_0_10_49_15 TaxID=1974587 RepID=A0A2H0UL02_9BACT|nr:MAG: hypothetical protein COU11_02585 [Candidatus Harrisonbacteria bacterium CG10_big_fil_rev_8_21_14_0_10_49_15]